MSHLDTACSGWRTVAPIDGRRKLAGSLVEDAGGNCQRIERPADLDRDGVDALDRRRWVGHPNPGSRHGSRARVADLHVDDGDRDRVRTFFTVVVAAVDQESVVRVRRDGGRGWRAAITPVNV